MNKLQIWLMRRYCPKYDEQMPEDKPGRYSAEVIVISGYWGNRVEVVASKEVDGYLNAYMTARWLALVEDFMHPKWSFSIGIYWGVKDMKGAKA